MSNNSNQHDHPTIFGSGCHIKGEVAVEGDATVFGTIEGPMQVTGTLEIAEDGGVGGDVVTGALTLNGRVHGDVHCEGVLQLNGRIEGNVTCGKVELGSESTLVGDLRAKTIAVNEGAIYRGEVIIGPDAMDEPAHSSRQAEAEEHRPASANHAPGGNGNGSHERQEVKTTSATRTAVSGLLRKRHELLNK